MQDRFARFFPRRSFRPHPLTRRIGLALVYALLLSAMLAQGARLHVSHADAAPLPAHASLHEHVSAGTDGTPAEHHKGGAGQKTDIASFAHCPLCAPLPSAVAVSPRPTVETLSAFDSRRTGLSPEPAKRPPRA